MAGLRIESNLTAPKASVSAPAYKPPVAAPKPEAAPVSKPEITPDKRPAQPDKTVPKDAGREEALVKEYGPVVSSSEDGDTLRVKSDDDKDKKDQQAAYAPVTTREEKLTDYEPPKPVVQDFEFPENVSAKASDSADSSKVTSSQFSGYTESQLDAMYLKGEISKSDYDKAIEAKEEARESRNQQDNEFMKNMAEDVRKITDNKNTEVMIENLGSDDSSDTIPIDVRAKALINLDNMTG